MKRIRVMVVDDSVVIRKLVTDALSTDPEIEVVGTAPNGRLALQKLTQLQPDIVTMDVEMPEMDGLTALTELRKTHPKLPVIMFSTLTERGGQATLEALSRGATDYVTKPANVGSVTEGIVRVRDELIPKIRCLTGRREVIKASPAAAKPVTMVRKPLPGVKGNLSGNRVDAIVIGVSTGGPAALSRMLPTLSASFPVPVLVVQHMPPVFTRLLAERLSATCKNPVCEGRAGMVVQPGRIYIAPGGFHMVMRRAGAAGEQLVLDLNSEAPENSCRPAVDVLFRSAASHYGPRLLAAVLTGMGADGMRGAEVIKDGGGQVFAQDEASCVVWGMPGAVVNAGLADGVLPLDEIGPLLNRAVQSGRVARVA